MQATAKSISLMLLALLCLWPAAAMGTYYNSLGELGINSESEITTGDKEFLKPDPADQGMGWYLNKAYSFPERHLHQIISEENWQDWVRFQHSNEVMIPVSSVMMYKVHYLESALQHEREKTALPPLRVSRRNISSLKLISRQLAPQRWISADRERDPIEVDRPWSPVSWLFEQDGLFSPDPWAASNLLPRIITIVGLVLGGIIAVEFLRLLVRTGARMMKGRRRKREEE